MFGNKAYEKALEVLEDHIKRQNKIIEGLMRQLLNQESKVNITQAVPEIPKEEGIIDDEADLERLRPLFGNIPTPGSIVNGDA